MCDPECASIINEANSGVSVCIYVLLKIVPQITAHKCIPHVYRNSHSAAIDVNHFYVCDRIEP